MAVRRFTTPKQGITIFIVLWLCLMSTSWAQAQTEQPITHLEHNGYDRTYHVVTPTSYEEGTPLPLLIALHGTGMSGKAMQALTDFDTMAETYGFLVAYPNSASPQWAFNTADDAGDIDDLGYIQALITQMQQDYSIAQDQVYLAGYGSGGLMAARLACTIPEQLNSVVVVGPMLLGAFESECAEPASAPVSLLFMHGSEDPMYLSEGDAANDIWSVQASLDFWAERNGCDTATIHEEENIFIYDDCPADGSIALYTVLGGKQNWPRIGDYSLNNFGIDATEIISRYLLRETLGDESWQITQEAPYEDLARGYTFYVPSTYDANEPMPAIVLLHGKGSTGTSTSSSSEMIPIAEREGIIMIYPDGINNEWQYMRGMPYYRDQGIDDTQFLRDLVSDLSKDLNIDASRVYVGGISNGGFMTQRLACDGLDTFAAFGSVMASAFYGLDLICADQPPAPLMMVSGTGDPIVPWEGTPMQLPDGMVYLSAPVPSTVQFWVEHNGCDEQDYTVEEVAPSREDTSLRILDMDHCQGRGRLRFYAVINGGHTWPGVDWDSESLLGKTNFDINTGEELWQFFQQYTLPTTEPAD
ncbi:hypothetical protein G4Y79_19940 [Phototrophicus methaneseepsis]|uniref:Phospholipase/carboxylesterase/thioesterase domain-containing protein n=1 Tax=Phototrophicus methaneseepsis TaxID=2710758 RepID=A0A7S8E7S7_9CHLR|nr:PHB depolymerase family esterase [Phototrophicus methaneseepsis]QPC81936.1 hypothetical protein G4Y79_19940 [Phototrophicus methaneseepsis]